MNSVAVTRTAPVLDFAAGPNATLPITDRLDDDGDDDDFSITISSGIQPTYTWQGGPARRIDVVPTADPLVPVWSVATTTFPHMPSPVRHGTVPTGAIELENAERTLRIGVNYRVRITLADNTQSSRDFRP